MRSILFLIQFFYFGCSCVDQNSNTFTPRITDTTSNNFFYQIADSVKLTTIYFDTIYFPASIETFDASSSLAKEIYPYISGIASSNNVKSATKYTYFVTKNGDAFDTSIVSKIEKLSYNPELSKIIYYDYADSNYISRVDMYKNGKVVENVIYYPLTNMVNSADEIDSSKVCYDSIFMKSGALSDVAIHYNNGDSMYYKSISYSNLGGIKRSWEMLNSDVTVDTYGSNVLYAHSDNFITFPMALLDVGTDLDKEIIQFYRSFVMDTLLDKIEREEESFLRYTNDKIICETYLLDINSQYGIRTKTVVKDSIAIVDSLFYSQGDVVDSLTHVVSFLEYNKIYYDMFYMSEIDDKYYKNGVLTESSFDSISFTFTDRTQPHPVRIFALRNSRPFVVVKEFDNETALLLKETFFMGDSITVENYLDSCNTIGITEWKYEFYE